MSAPEAILPSPTEEVPADLDLVAMMMLLMEEMSRLGMDHSKQKIQAKQAKLNEAYKSFMAELQESLKKAEESPQRDNGSGVFGWLGDLADSVAKFVGEVVGTVVGGAVEFVVDTVMAPIDIAIGLAKGESLAALIDQELHDLKEMDGIGKAIKGFSVGLTKLAVDAMKCCSAVFAAMEAGLSGKSIWEAVQLQVENLGKSFVENVVENPDFMEVVGTALKVVAIAGAVMSGGALAVVAVGLYALSELEQRHGLAEAAFGKEVGGYVSLGIQVASTVAMAVAGGGGGLSELGTAGGKLQLAASLAQAGISGLQAYRRYENTLAAAGDLEQQADIQQAHNRLQRLQRMLAELIDQLEGQSKEHSRLVRGASQVFQTQGAVMEAAVIRG